MLPRGHRRRRDDLGVGIGMDRASQAALHAGSVRAAIKQYHGDTPRWVSSAGAEMQRTGSEREGRGGREWEDRMGGQRTPVPGEGSNASARETKQENEHARGLPGATIAKMRWVVERRTKEASRFVSGLMHAVVSENGEARERRIRTGKK